MYTIVLPVPVYDAGGGRVVMPAGLHRDLAAHARHERRLRVLCPRAASADHVPDPTELGTAAGGDGLSVGLLPWDGRRRTWPRAAPAVARALAAEAARADVWHTCCSLGLWDLTTVSYRVGRRAARGLRVICLDSDPASMLRSSGRVAALKSVLVRRSLVARVRRADAAIFVGRGVEQGYAAAARASVTTNAVWLADSDLADEADTRAKFAAGGPVRIALPSRLTAWKGVDDAVRGVARLGDRAGPIALDVYGDGDQLPALQELVRSLGVGDRVRFLPPLRYGEPFFRALRGYHLVLAPTRGLEEARVVYDAVASGCLLVHSATPTLEAGLRDVPLRWPHPPGDPAGVAAAIERAVGRRAEWAAAAAAGIRLMRGRTIDEMHRVRAAFLRTLRPAAG